MGAAIITLITSLLGGGLQIFSSVSQTKQLKLETASLKQAAANETNTMLYAIYMEKIKKKEAESQAKQREQQVSLIVVFISILFSFYLIFKPKSNNQNVRHKEHIANREG